ncbi:unnamed protein product [Trichobilharzia regenti]|nr:unnamed protein product [Trichobilharzia regenti]
MTRCARGGSRGPSGLVDNNALAFETMYTGPSNNNNSMHNIRRGIDDGDNKRTTRTMMNRTPNRDMGGLKPLSLNNTGIDSGNHMIADKPVCSSSSIGRHNSMRSLAASNRPTSLSRTASVS